MLLTRCEVLSKEKNLRFKGQYRKSCVPNAKNMNQSKNERIFRSTCPVFNCDKTKLFIWHHYGCPTFSKTYISDLGIVRCEYCGMRENLINTKFDCGLHGEKKSNESIGTIRFKCPPKTLRGILAIIGGFEDDGIFSTEFIDKLANAVTI